MALDLASLSVGKADVSVSLGDLVQATAALCGLIKYVLPARCECGNPMEIRHCTNSMYFVRLAVWMVPVTVGSCIGFYYAGRRHVYAYVIDRLDRKR